MKLYGSTTSPFVGLVLVTAQECGLGDRIELIREALSVTEVNADITTVSGLGKVPVLVTDHGHAVYDSRVIVDYLVHHAGNSTLIPHDPVLRYRVLTLQALAVGLMDLAVAYRYETFARPKHLLWAEWVSRADLRFQSSLDELEKNWGEHLQAVNVGSLATAVALAYLDLRFPDMDWRAQRPRLVAFFDAFSQRASMVQNKLGRA